MSDWNQRIIDEFRANDGRVGGPFEGRTLLLLHHRGAKTGTERINPLAYQRLSGDSVAVFASKSGAPTNPDWYHNLLANPDVTVEIGTETLPRGRVSPAAKSENRSSSGRSATGPGLPSTKRRPKGSETSPSSCSRRPNRSTVSHALGQAFRSVPYGSMVAAPARSTEGQPESHNGRELPSFRHPQAA